MLLNKIVKSFRYLIINENMILKINLNQQIDNFLITDYRKNY